MAVPKQKQSHSRTAKRRAQHKMAAPVYNACPTCHEPRRPHRVCASCGSYKGSEVVAPHAHDQRQAAQPGRAPLPQAAYDQAALDHDHDR